MRSEYHAEVTTRALGAHFSPRALAVIVAANLAQDNPQYLIGYPEIHFDNCAFDAARARVAALRDQVAALSDPAHQWRALGALTHTVQDFYYLSVARFLTDQQLRRPSKNIHRSHHNLFAWHRRPRR